MPKIFCCTYPYSWLTGWPSTQIQCVLFADRDCYLVGGFNHLQKYYIVNWEGLSPTIKNVWNHQPAIIVYFAHAVWCAMDEGDYWRGCSFVVWRCPPSTQIPQPCSPVLADGFPVLAGNNLQVWLGPSGNWTVIEHSHGTYSFHRWLIYTFRKVIFHSYVKLPKRIIIVT